MFIVLEGSEGSGKSTLIESLKMDLMTLGEKIFITREPGGTPVAEKIRDIVKYNTDSETFHPETELLLMEAARIQHVKNAIIPKLDSGYIVISDRFIHSTFAYQGCGRGIDLSLIDQLHQNFIKVKPDLVFYLDLDYQTSQERIQQRGKQQKDRFDFLDVDFSARVNECFLSYVNEKDFFLIDSSQNKHNVKEQVLSIILRELKKEQKRSIEEFAQNSENSLSLSVHSDLLKGVYQQRKGDLNES
jgi:dTMP kinase